MKPINDTPQSQSQSPQDCVKKEVHWYALFVQSLHERKIVQLLNDREQENMSRPEPFRKPVVVEEAYVPTKEVKRRWSDRVKVIKQVLTPGLIFVRMKMENQRDIYVDSHIRHFLYDREKRNPAVIPDEQMELFKRVVAGEVDLSLCTPELGDKVRILRGPYEGYTAVVTRKDNSNNIKIQLCYNLAFQFSINQGEVALTTEDAVDRMPDERYR